MTPQLTFPAPNLHQNFLFIFSTVFMTFSHSCLQLSRKLDRSSKISISVRWQLQLPSCLNQQSRGQHLSLPFIYPTSSSTLYLSVSLPLLVYSVCLHCYHHDSSPGLLPSPANWPHCLHVWHLPSISQTFTMQELKSDHVVTMLNIFHLLPTVLKVKSTLLTLNCKVLYDRLPVDFIFLFSLS